IFVIFFSAPLRPKRIRFAAASSSSRFFASRLFSARVFSPAAFSRRALFRKEEKLTIFPLSDSITCLLAGDVAPGPLRSFGNPRTNPVREEPKTCARHVWFAAGDAFEFDPDLYCGSSRSIAFCSACWAESGGLEPVSCRDRGAGIRNGRASCQHRR